MPLNFFYTMVQKSQKWPKTQIKGGGSCLKQASNFGGTFDQLFLWIFFMRFSQKMPLYFFYTMAQKVKNGQKLKSRGSCLKFLASWKKLSTFHEVCIFFD